MAIINLERESKQKPITFSPLREASAVAGKFSGWALGKFKSEVLFPFRARAGSGILEPHPIEVKTQLVMGEEGLVIETMQNGKKVYRAIEGREVRFKGVVGGVMMGDDPFKIDRPGSSKKIPADKAMAAFAGLPYAAINAIACEVSTIRWRLFKVQADEDHEELFAHELLDLIEGVNEMQTGVELRYTMMTHLELTGNSYWLMLDKNRKPVSKGQRPAQIFTLDPSRVELKFDKTDFPYILTKYIFTIDGRKFTYDPHQILHIKYPDPSDPYTGLGPLQAIAPWVDNDNYATEFNRRFFINGARIDGVLQSEMTAEDTIKQLQTSWDINQTGVENAHKTPVLPKGVKYVPMQASPKDMDFPGLQNNSRDRIFMGFRVSKTVLGTAESDTNRATAETADYVFAKRTIRPKMEMIVSYLNEFLVPLFGKDIYLSYEDPVPEDAEFRTKEMQAVVGSQPVMTPNEARENYMGLGPVEGGDELFSSTQFAPISEGAKEREEGPRGPGEEEGEEEPGKTDDDKEEEDKKAAARHSLRRVVNRHVIKRHFGGKTTRFASTSSFRSEISKALTERVAKAISIEIAIAEKKGAKLNKDEARALWAKIAERLEPYEQSIAKHLRAINHEQEKEVQANLSKATGIKSVDAGALFDQQKWVGITIDALTPILTELGIKEGAAAAALVGYVPSGTVWDAPAAQNALKTAIDKLADSYNTTVRNTLASKLEDGIKNGDSLEQLSASVSDIYAFQDEYAATRLAKTETFRISNMASLESWKQSGTVKTVIWQVQSDNPCEFCETLDGSEETTGDNFADDGDTITSKDGGSYAVDYGDVDTPPLHPNCQCILIPGDISLD